MDALDILTLASLEHDGADFAALAEDVGLSRTPARVQELEKTGAITGYGAQVDPSAIGFGVFAFVEVMIDFRVVRSSSRSAQQCRNTGLLHHRRI